MHHKMQSNKQDEGLIFICQLPNFFWNPVEKSDVGQNLHITKYCTWSY